MSGFRKRRHRKRQERRRRFKVRLWQEQNGLCYWCDSPMDLVFDPPKSKTPMDGNLATFDHLDDKFSPERGKHDGEIRTMLACLSCNNKRGAISQAAQPIEELWKRAGRHRGAEMQ